MEGAADINSASSSRAAIISPPTSCSTGSIDARMAHTIVEKQSTIAEALDGDMLVNAH